MNAPLFPGTLALRLDGVTKRFPGVVGARQRGPRSASRRGPCAARRERRRQVDPHQDSQRRPCRRRRRFSRRPGPVARDDPQGGPAARHHCGAAGHPDGAGTVDRAEYSAGRRRGARAARPARAGPSERIVEAALAKVGANFDADAKTSNLSVPQPAPRADRPGARAPGEMMILDEPTAVLSEPDAELLLERLHAIPRRGQGDALCHASPFRSDAAWPTASRSCVTENGSACSGAARFRATISSG